VKRRKTKDSALNGRLKVFSRFKLI
jgi:hypothetical protein